MYIHTYIHTHKYTHTHTYSRLIGVCVCVCVCVRERDVFECVPVWYWIYQKCFPSTETDSWTLVLCSFRNFLIYCPNTHLKQTNLFFLLLLFILQLIIKTARFDFDLFQTWVERRWIAQRTPWPWIQHQQMMCAQMKEMFPLSSQHRKFQRQKYHQLSCHLHSNKHLTVHDHRALCYILT